MTSKKTTLTGTIKDLRVHKTSKGEKMAFASLENEDNDKIDVVFFSLVWKECKAKIKEGKFVTLSGKIDSNVKDNKTGKNGFTVASVLPCVKKTAVST